MEGIGTDHVLLVVAEAVFIAILLAPLQVCRNVRVEFRYNLIRVDRLRILNIREVKPLAGNRPIIIKADRRRIPVVVFIAVGDLVAIGIQLGRIGAVLDGEAPCGGIGLLVANPRLTNAVLRIGAHVIVGHDIGVVVGAPGQMGVSRYIAVEGLDLGRTQVEVGNPDVAICYREHAHVETLVEAAELKRRRERLAARIPTGSGRDRAAGQLVIGRQIVPIFIYRGTLAKFAAIAVYINKRFAGRPDLGNREVVGQAVIVDIAHVIGGVVFPREDGLDNSIGVLSALSGSRVGQGNPVLGCRAALELGRGSAAVDGRRNDSTALFLSREEETVEERVDSTVRGVDILRTRSERLLAASSIVAVLVQRNISLELGGAIEVAVINRICLVPVGPDIYHQIKAAVPRKLESFSSGEVASREDVAFAQTIGQGIPLRHTGAGGSA